MKITAIAPTRISYFGGGSDINTYAKRYGGVCLNMAINLRQKFIFDRDSTKIKILGVNKFHEAFLGTGKYGLEQTCTAELEAGLGTSASAAVALHGILYKLHKVEETKIRIAEEAWNIEVHLLNLFGGKQDQYAASCGGCNIMNFDTMVKVKGIPKNLAEGLAKRTMLFYTGRNRTSTKIQEEFKELDNKQMVALNDLKRVAYQAIDLLKKKDYKQMGHLLSVGWHYKKVSNPKLTTRRIDNIHKVALKMGAWGGKLCGSGGGGYMIFMSGSDNKARIIDRLKEQGVKHVPFKIDWEGLVVK